VDAAVKGHGIAIIAPMKARQLFLASLVMCAGLAETRPGFAQSNSPNAPTPSAVVTVPFVGCASDGMDGPHKAPAGKSLAIAAPAAIAKRLAYYKAEYSSGVLAPRGWNCFSTYGSNGASIFVSPDPIDPKAFFSQDWKGFPGQVIQLSWDSGGTSGRFEVAEVIARVFPAYKSFVQKVIAEGIQPASDFPTGPYASDKLTYRGKNIVEFETPANSHGLGTDSLIEMNANSILGVAIISGTDTDLTHLSARVPTADSDLVRFIVIGAESEAIAGKS
jgi:hypothetical protein